MRAVTACVRRQSPLSPTGVASPSDSGRQIRRRLAALMAVAYAGTVDETSTVSHSRITAAEAQRTIAGHYGEVQWGASLLAHRSRDVWIGTNSRDPRTAGSCCLRSLWLRQYGIIKASEVALIVRSGNLLAAQGATDVDARRDGRESRATPLRASRLSRRQQLMTAARRGTRDTAVLESSSARYARRLLRKVATRAFPRKRLRSGDETAAAVVRPRRRPIRPSPGRCCAARA